MGTNPSGALIGALYRGIQHHAIQEHGHGSRIMKPGRPCQDRPASGIAGCPGRSCSSAPTRPIAPRLFCYLLLALAGLCLFEATGALQTPLGAEAQSPASHEPSREEVLAGIDDLWRAGQADSASALSESLLAIARAESDSVFLLELLTRQGSMWASLGRAKHAEPYLHEAMSLAEILEDSLRIRSSLRWLGATFDAQGRRSEALDAYARLVAISSAAGDGYHEGWGRLGLAWSALINGRVKDGEAEYRRALQIFERIGENQGKVWALNGLAKALARLGAYEEAQESYRRAAASVNEETGTEGARNYILSNILNDMGTLEFYLGDPGTAQEHFQRSYDIQQTTGNVRGWITPALNVAICQSYLGQYDDAARVVEDIIAVCEERNYRNLLGKALSQLATVRKLQGRYHESAAVLRHTLSLGDVLSLSRRIETREQLSAVLAKMDSTSQSLAVLEEGVQLLDGASDVRLEAEIRSYLGMRLLEVGRHEEALANLLFMEHEAKRLGIHRFRLGNLARIARAYRALGMRDSAMAALEEAAAVWETNRAVPLNPEWREQRGAHGRLVSTDLASLLLESPAAPTDRRRLAYDRLQVFKARTLLERMVGPGEALETAYETGVPEPATLEMLQKDVLREGELLLDAFLGPQNSYLFGVTREECRVARLPSDEVLKEKLELFFSLLSRPPAEEATIDDRLLTRIGGAIGKQLLGDFADMITRSERILVSPDGVLNLVPFGALPLLPTGEDDSAADPEWLITDKELTRTPSASFLTWHRRHEPEFGDKPSSRVLAVASDRTDTGEALPGAVREVRQLAGRYENVARMIVSGDSCSVPIADILGDYDVLHFAAHARVDDQHPWRSMIRFCREDESHNPRADRIASMQLPARLAVLSNCQSAGGRVVSGEGVQGLSSAFLSAGVPTVVATLWAVDDRATARLMEHFYERLAQGETAAAALRVAQISLSEDSRTQHPYFWAGFVLVGDGEVRAELPRRQNTLLYFVLGVLAFGLALGYRLIRSRTKTPRAA